MTVFGPRCPLEASKSPPRASQEPAKSFPKGPQSLQKALHSLQEPPVRPPRGLQEPALQTFLHSLTEDTNPKASYASSITARPPSQRTQIPKSLPKRSREPPKSFPKAFQVDSAAFKNLTLGFQAHSKIFIDQHAFHSPRDPPIRPSSGIEKLALQISLHSLSKCKTCKIQHPCKPNISYLSCTCSSSEAIARMYANLYASIQRIQKTRNRRQRINAGTVADQHETGHG